MAETLDPEMAAAIPQEFNPEALSAWRDAGLTESERNARRTRAVAEARLAMDQKADEREATEWWEKSLGNWARTVDDQQGWDEMLTFARVQGAPESVIQKAGVEFSPAAVKRLTGPEDAERTGNLEQEITRAALAGDMETVTLLTRVSGRLASARRGPASGQRQPVIAPEDREAMVAWVMGNPDAWNRLPADMRGDLTPDLARRGFTLPPQRDPAAVTWRATEIQKLNERRDNLASDITRDPMPEDTYRQQRRFIEDAYRMRLGEPPLTDEEFVLVLADKPIRQRGSAGSAAAAPTPPVRPMPSTPRTSPSAPPRPSVDADAVVRERLAKEEPGEYELANGQVWVKDASGQIRRVK
jgi:hypothetical protein